MKQLVELLGPVGCRPPICNILGINAFFIRADCGDLFAELPIERLYQALRGYLSPIEPAQPPSLSCFRDRLQDGGRR